MWRGTEPQQTLKKRRQRKTERKHDVPSWLVLAQLLILVYPAPYFLLVFLRPLSPAEFRCVPWRAQGGGGRRGGRAWRSLVLCAAHRWHVLPVSCAAALGGVACLARHPMLCC